MPPTPAASLTAWLRRRRVYGGWRFTNHALTRMEQMDVAHPVVVHVLTHCQLDRPADRDGLRMASCKRVPGHPPLSVVYVPDEYLVITVLPWTDETYSR